MLNPPFRALGVEIDASELENLWIEPPAAGRDRRNDFFLAVSSMAAARKVLVCAAPDLSQPVRYPPTA
jgi:hypothetical protein